MTRGDDSPVASITIDALDPEEQRLWQTVAAVAERLGEDERWCLVGGLMVALFSIQEAQTPRVTTDIHVLANARARPSGTTWATQRLEEMGATLCKVDGVDGQRGFRFELDGQIIDVVAPDGLGKAATTAGKLETIQIPGGTQALARTEIVEIVVDGVSSRVRRPTLLGDSHATSGRFEGRDCGGPVSGFVVHGAPGRGPEPHVHPYPETLVVFEVAAVWWRHARGGERGPFVPRQSTEPAGRTQWQGWPVTVAIRSKSAS